MVKPKAGSGVVRLRVWGTTPSLTAIIENAASREPAKHVGVKAITRTCNRTEIDRHKHRDFERRSTEDATQYYENKENIAITRRLHKYKQGGVALEKTLCWATTQTITLYIGEELKRGVRGRSVG